MAKSKSSDMVRVPNELIEAVKKISQLYREGYATEVVKGMAMLSSAVERGESFGNQAIAQRLEQLERLVALKAAAPPQEAAPTTEVLSEAELCQRFGIGGFWHERAIADGKAPEQWLALQVGWQYLGGGKYASQ